MPGWDRSASSTLAFASLSTATIVCDTESRAWPTPPRHRPCARLRRGSLGPPGPVEVGDLLICSARSAFLLGLGIGLEPVSGPTASRSSPRRRPLRRCSLAALAGPSTSPTIPGIEGLRFRSSAAAVSLSTTGSVPAAGSAGAGGPSPSAARRPLRWPSLPTTDAGAGVAAAGSVESRAATPASAHWSARAGSVSPTGSIEPRRRRGPGRCSAPAVGRRCGQRRRTAGWPASRTRDRSAPASTRATMPPAPSPAQRHRPCGPGPAGRRTRSAAPSRDPRETRADPPTEVFPPAPCSPWCPDRWRPGSRRSRYGRARRLSPGRLRLYGRPGRVAAPCHRSPFPPAGAKVRRPGALLRPAERWRRQARGPSRATPPTVAAHPSAVARCDRGVSRAGRGPARFASTPATAACRSDAGGALMSAAGETVPGTDECLVGRSGTAAVPLGRASGCSGDTLRPRRPRPISTQRRLLPGPARRCRSQPAVSSAGATSSRPHRARRSAPRGRPRATDPAADLRVPVAVYEE